jgi:hypothetical protein
VYVPGPLGNHAEGELMNGRLRLHDGDITVLLYDVLYTGSATGRFWLDVNAEPDLFRRDLSQRRSHLNSITNVQSPQTTILHHLRPQRDRIARGTPGLIRARKGPQVVSV